MNQNKTPISILKTKETMAIAVAERYTADEAFRASFDRDPKAAISKHFDLVQEDWPVNMQLTVLRNDDQCMHVGVPILSSGSRRIPDAVLAKVSGGWGGDPDPWGGLSYHPFMSWPTP